MMNSISMLKRMCFPAIGASTLHTTHTHAANDEGVDKPTSRPPNGKTTLGQPHLQEAADRGVIPLHGKDALKPSATVCTAARGTPVPTLCCSSASTSLHAAARMDHLPTMLHIIKSEVDVNAADSRGLAPLHVAVDEGHLDAAQLLLSSGASSKVIKSDGTTPLHLAAKRGDAQAIDLLVTAGAAPSAASGSAHITPLHLAAQGGHAPAIATLLQRGADAMSRDSSGNTPLHLAVASGHAQAAFALLSHPGTSPVKLAAAANNGGNTPLHLAAYQGHLSVTKALLQTLQAEQIAPPAAVAASAATASATHACVTALNHHGASPLPYAAMRGHAATAEVLASFADQQHLYEAAQVAVTSSQWSAAAALIKELHKKDPNSLPAAEKPQAAGAAPSSSTSKATASAPSAAAAGGGGGGHGSGRGAAPATAQDTEEQLAKQMHELLHGLPAEQLEDLICALAQGWATEVGKRAQQQQQLDAEHREMQTEKAGWQHLFVGILLDAKRGHSQPPACDS